SVARAPARYSLLPYTTLFRSFDDVTLRRELLHRFNAISGIDLPGDSLNRRPSFPLQSLVGEGGKHTLDVCCGSVSVARRGCPSEDRKSTRLNSSHVSTSYAVF